MRRRRTSAYYGSEEQKERVLIELRAATAAAALMESPGEACAASYPWLPEDLHRLVHALFFEYELEFFEAVPVRADLSAAHDTWWRIVTARAVSIPDMLRPYIAVPTILAEHVVRGFGTAEGVWRAAQQQLLRIVRAAPIL